MAAKPGEGMRQHIETITVPTQGTGMLDVTDRVAGRLEAAGAAAGLLTLFVRHSSASLTIQENADPDVRRDLLDALDRLAPRDAPYIHSIEGPDDMPAHIRAMLTGTSLQVPVDRGRMMLGTWQGLYLIEHRDRPHRRELVLCFQGEFSR